MRHKPTNYYHMKVFQRIFLCISTLLLISGVVYSQFDYRLELEKRLYPKVDTATTKEVALFISKPSFVEPEYSIRIIDIGNQSFIEARILDKNLWHEQFKQNKQTDSLSVESYCYSAPVSTTFRNKVVVAFSKIIVLNQNKIKANELPNASGIYKGRQIFDGTCYEFKINDNGKILSTTLADELKYNDFEYQVAMTNLRIIDALKRHFFNDSVYKVYNEP